jgi:hypothetical protein
MRADGRSRDVFIARRVLTSYRPEPGFIFHASPAYCSAALILKGHGFSRAVNSAS